MLHDETRSRWEQFPGDKFIHVVLHGALREKINTAYTVIHVYAQIIHQLPATAVIDVQDTEEIALRDLFMQMRDSIALVHDADDTPTLPEGYTPGDYILSVVNEARKNITTIRKCAQAIHADEGVRLTGFPELNGRRLGDIALDVLKHVSEITQLLDFAQAYADNITHHARSS